MMLYEELSNLPLMFFCNNHLAPKLFQIQKFKYVNFPKIQQNFKKFEFSKSCYLQQQIRSSEMTILTARECSGQSPSQLLPATLLITLL